MADHKNSQNPDKLMHEMPGCLALKIKVMGSVVNVVSQHIKIMCMY